MEFQTWFYRRYMAQFIELIELDPRSWLGANRNWRPQTRADLPNVELGFVGRLVT